MKKLIGMVLGLALAASAFAGNFLVNSQGMTVYVFDVDQPGVSNCYDQCAVAWPPVAYTGGALPAGYSAITRKDGTQQLAFDNRPLYTYIGDQAPGQTNGDGVDGTWHIVTP
jgi:predicted lipoprotein with Yx(FWY)xxD motif